MTPRLPWLVTGLAGGVLSAVVLSRFEEDLAAVIALAFFVPVIMAMGGNVAIQSSAVMVRALATEDLRPRDASRRLAREVGVSIITGVVCGIRVEEIENPLTQQVRYLDKLVDELAKGKKMEKILREP